MFQSLTKAELEALLPPGTFSRTLRKLSWAKITEILQCQSSETIALLKQANKSKEREKKRKHGEKH